MDKVIIINIEDLYPDRRKCLIPIEETFTTVADVERYLKHNFQLEEEFFLESRSIWIPNFTKVDVLKSLEEVRLRIVRPQSENETGRSEEGKQTKKKDKKKRKLSLEPDTHPIQNENIEEESVTQVKKKKKRREENEENARESSIIVVGEDDNMIPKKEKKKKKKDRDADTTQSSDLPSIIVENGERIENDDKEVDGGTAESEQVETPNRRKRIRKRKKKSEKKLEFSVDVLAKAKEQAMLLVNSRLNFAASSWGQPTRNKHIRFDDNEVEGERKEMTGTALDTSATHDPSSEESGDRESSVTTLSSKPPNSESKISRSQHEDFEKTVKSPPVYTRNLYSNQSFPNAGESSNMTTINPNTSFSKVTESSDKNVKKAENLLEDLDFEEDKGRYKVPVYYRKPFSNQTVLITSGVVQTKTEIDSIKKPVSEKIGLASFGDEFESSRNSKDRLEIGSRIVHGFEKNNLGKVNEKQEYKNNVGQGSRGAENMNEEFENNVEPIKTETSVEDGNNESMEVLKSDEAIASIRKSKNSITVTIEKLNNSATIEKIREELNVQCVNKTEKEDVGEGEQEESDKSGGSCLKRMKFSDEDSGEGTNGMEVDEDVEKVEDRDSKQEKVSVEYCENEKDESLKDIKLYDKDGEKLMIKGMSVTELSIGNNSHNKEIVVNKDFLETKIEDVDMGEERFSNKNNPSDFNEIGENYEESEERSDSNENCDKECATEIGTHENDEEREESSVNNENGDECGTDEGTHENGEEGRGNEGKQEEDRVEENGDKRETDVKNYENGNNEGGDQKEGEDRRQETGNKENGEKERVTVTKTHENRDNGENETKTHEIRDNGGDETKTNENRDNGGNEDVEGNKDGRDSNENPGNEGKKNCQKSKGTGNVGIREEGSNEGNMKNGKYVRTMKKKGKIESTNRVKLSALSVLPLPSIGKATAPMRLPEAKPKPRQDVTYTTPEFSVGDIISFKTLFMGSSAMPIVTDEIIGKILAIKEKIKLEVFCGTVKLGSVRNRLSNEDCDDDLKEFLPGSVVLLSLSEMIGPRKVEQVLPQKS